MANGKASVAPPVAGNDFFKTNGSDTVVFNKEPSMTRQEFMEECDINALMKRYEGHVIGGPGNLAPVVPVYVDWTQMPTDLMNYMDRMFEAENAFMTLPAVVRKEFDNSAAAFVEFAADPGNLDQMRSWGLAPPVAAGASAPAGAPAAPGPAPVGGSVPPASQVPPTGAPSPG